MKKKIIKDGAKEQLMEGAKLLYEAVSATLGPKGQNVVIESYGEPIVTHDGVTVAKSIEIDSPDRPGARIGVEMVKASSSKTNDNVGDGTTTSTILAYHLIREGMEFVKLNKNSMILRKELEEASYEALAALELLAEPVDSKEKAISIAKISSESSEIGEIVGSMFHKLGKDAMISVEIGQKTELEHDIVEGYSFDRGLISPYMIRDSRTQSTTCEQAPILISSKSLGLSDIEPLLSELYQEGFDQVVIITDDFKSDLIAHSIAQRGKFDIIGIKAPGFGENRLELLRDVASLADTKVYDGTSSFAISDLGTCDKIIASTKETVMTGLKDAKDRIIDIKAKIKDGKSEYEKDKLEKRLAQIRGKVGVLRVGGATEMAAEETKYLVDDAVAATQAAMKEGVVAGGGVTYLQLINSIVSDTDGAKVLKKALEYPFRVLMENAGERPGQKLKELVGTEPYTGFNVMTGEMTNLKEIGVIDPVLVVKQAITNSVSVAGSVLTAGVLIVNDEEKNDEKEE